MPLTDTLSCFPKVKQLGKQRGFKSIRDKLFCQPTATQLRFLRLITVMGGEAECPRVMMQSQLQTRQRLIELFGRGPALLSDALRRCPKKMWLYRPAPQRWR